MPLARRGGGTAPVGELENLTPDSDLAAQKHCDTKLHQNHRILIFVDKLDIHTHIITGELYIVSDGMIRCFVQVYFISGGGILYKKALKIHLSIYECIRYG